MTTNFCLDIGFSDKARISVWENGKIVDTIHPDDPRWKDAYADIKKAMGW